MELFCTRSVNAGFEPHRTVDYKTIVDEAVKKSGDVADRLKCIIFNRAEEKRANLMSGRDRDWNDLMASAHESNSDCVPVEANHPLYILYTSGMS